MNTATWTQVMYIAFAIFFAYFLALMAFYIFLAIFGLLEEKKRAEELESENYPLIYFSNLALPVSIVVPAHNEEVWIRDALLSIVKLNYPKFELIIVDDGSTDRTFEILNELLDLKAVNCIFPQHYQSGTIRTIFSSIKYPNVTVIQKDAGNKKAGAVNAALNLAKNDFICVMDADTILERDALLKVMAHVSRNPQEIVGIGSGFGLANGFTIKDGLVLSRDSSFNPIVAYQNLEYIRSFIGNRLAWSKFNAMPNVAGGFGIWRSDVLYALGGYSAEFTCEDIELTFRAHEYFRKNREQNYEILMMPYYIGWTEGPSSATTLIQQRDRWQRVVIETVTKYIHMLCNPKYGSFAFLAYPYFLFYEVLGVFVEILSVAFVTIGWALNILDTNAFFAMLVLMLLSQWIVSLISIFTFAQNQRVFKLRYLIYLVFLSSVEMVGYRLLISLAKLRGTYNYLRGNRFYDQYKRAKRNEKQAD